MKRQIFNRKYLLTFRKELRSEATTAENYLWKALRNRNLNGRKFRRQHSIGNYIVDFYCPEEKVIVELDGSIHFNPINENHDIERSNFFLALGLKVVRFENRIVFDRIDLVLEAIAAEFNQPPRPAGTPPSKGGE
jgi:very-short-patch-repair endonuclease